MRGDFSRIRLSKGKGYTAVLEQQGRVALDADENEQRFIDARLRRTETVDIIGEFGGPAGDEGFGITITGGQILIGAGRYYVDGLLVENPIKVPYDAQPISVPASDPDAANLLTAVREGAIAQLYLQVWQQFVTWLDDPCLREPALGQADTTARLQTVWRVVGRTKMDAGSGPFCPALYGLPPAASTGTLTVTTTAGPDCGCEPVAAAGYHGIENQLYRVEIQAGSDATEPTFKWSRENGSIVTAVTAVSGNAVTVSSLGPDANLGFQVGQWIELTDDSLRYADPPNQPGTLYQVVLVDKDTLTLTLSAPVASINTARNARARRWDQTGPAAGRNGVPLSPGTEIPLENGIAVTFDNGTYRPGDFWTFPARTATGTVEWPPCDSDGSPAQPPASLIVHEAPLAVLYRPARTTKESAEHDPVAIENCRRSFHPQTVATAIHVTGISWVNDDVMTLDQLAAKGLTITLDQVLSDPVTGAHYITGANFIVTLESVAELPEGSSATLRQIVIVDAATNLSEPESGTTAISWLLNQPALGSIEGFVSSGATQGVFARVRVKLLGQTIFASGASGPMYLDGCAFGLPAVRRDGSTPRVDLHLPSGAGVAASDFDGWFYLVPALQLSLSIAYPQLVVIVNEFNTVTGVATPQNPTTPVIPTATVTLNSAPAEDTEVSLTLSGQAGVSIPSSVSIGAGNVSQQFNITTTALNNPGANVTLPFTIVASVSSTAPQASATFTVAGVPNPETH